MSIIKGSPTVPSAKPSMDGHKSFGQLEILDKHPAPLLNAQIMLPTQDPEILRRLEFHLRLRKVWQYLNENYHEPIQLGTAAQIACMEKTAFSRFFRRATGVRFYDFVLSCRIEKSLDLMTASDQSITEIAYEVGFHNLSSFERSFKKFLSYAPRQYREVLLRNRGLIA